MASIVVRMMLFIGCFSVNEYPDVWQWVLNNRDFWFFGLNFSLTDSAHNLLSIDQKFHDRCELQVKEYKNCEKSLSMMNTHPFSLFAVVGD